jgi:two-component system, NtrC family, sensor histidine kinase KinB
LYACRDDCDRLQSTVDELLHLARIQGARIELDQRATGPASLVETTVDAHRPLAAKHYVQLEFDVPTGIGDVQADRERVRVVLANLLIHAIRRSPPGAVVTVRARPDAGEVRFEVADTGPVIPKELQPAIFDRFASADEGDAGAGVSLSFAKEIVEAHGGRIGVDSEPGQGSTFWFTLRSMTATPADAQPR